MWESIPLRVKGLDCAISKWGRSGNLKSLLEWEGVAGYFPSFIEPKIRLYCSETETGGMSGYKKICLAEDFTKELLKYYHDRALMKKDGKELASLLHRKYNKDRILEAWWKEVQQH